MERRINTKTRQYLLNFKNDIRAFVQKENILRIHFYNLCMIINHYNLKKLIFKKEKRVKNVVPFFERCRALRANGEQCTEEKMW